MMFKKMISFLLIFICLTASSLAEPAHEHTWGEWLPDEAGGHTATCTEDKETLTVKHYSFSVNFGQFSGSICCVCGKTPEGVLPIIEGAQAQSQKAKPSNQRGAFIVRGTGSPFSQEPGVLFAFTVAYVRDGALATWKDVSTVTIPLDINLPETARLIRVQPASGDDSIQNPEQHIEMEYSYADGILSFTTKTPALYMLIEST